MKTLINKKGVLILIADMYTIDGDFYVQNDRNYHKNLGLIETDVEIPEGARQGQWKLVDGNWYRHQAPTEEVV